LLPPRLPGPARSATSRPPKAASPPPPLAITAVLSQFEPPFTTPADIFLSAAVAVVVEEDDGEASMFVSKYFSWSRGAVVATTALLLLLCSSRLPLRGGTLGGGTATGFNAALAITGGGEKATAAAAFGEWSLALEPADGLKSLADWGRCFPGAEFNSGFWKRRTV
jgi:hypothetical protein